jgi:hypothetical protein
MIMTIVLRIILTALWLIVANLIIYDFQPGGRYLILMEAIITGLIAHGIRSLTGNGMDQRLRSLLGAGGLIPGLGLTRLIFNIKLAIPGVLLVYCGLVLVEMVLPEQIPELKVKS